MIIAKPFYFIRHGQTDWNTKGHIMGHIDIPLNETGRNQALQAKMHVEKLPITHIYYSPLARAAETAHLISQDMACAKIPLPELQERPFSEWHGDEYAQRVKQGVSHILQNSEVPLIVAHGGIYGGICRLLSVQEHAIHNCELIYFEPSRDATKSWTVTIIQKNS